MPKRYPREFREGALDLVKQGDRSVAEIAAELSIAESCLRRWMKQARVERGEVEDELDGGRGVPARGAVGRRVPGCHVRQPDADDFHRPYPLGELLAGAKPLASIDDLLIGELTDGEADAFLAAIGLSPLDRRSTPSIEHHG